MVSKFIIIQFPQTVFVSSHFVEALNHLWVCEAFK
jgi:hypothetical protein